ncbi:MAG: hypothetical protein NZM05_12605, partial [Chloroherpetonaceae bacterium]|nr:hypothetical protein [Chloroherpetonaceae bacterium]
TRFIASMTGIEISKLVKYRIEPKLLAKEEINQIEAALDSMKDMSKYVRIKYFKPKQLTPQKLADYLFEVEHCDKVKIRAVYHDYLKKLSYEGRAKDDYTGLGYITTELIGIAQDFCLPIWTPMQLNRGAKLGGFAGLQSSSANVGNSWQIIEDLDYVLIVEPIAENPEYMTIKVDKARRSEDNYKIQIRIRKNTCQIEECLVSPYSNDTDENEEEKYKQSLNGKGKKLSEQNASGWTWQRDEPSVF